MLNKALVHEINIFKKFNDYKEFGPYTVFYSPGTNEVPHWNLVYTMNDESGDLIDELREAKEFYSSQGLVGHRLKKEILDTEVFSENSEYFFFKNNLFSLDDSEAVIKKISSAEGPCYLDFLAIMKDAFRFDDSTINYFSKKMRIISTKVETVFYVAYVDGVGAATATTFVNDDESLFMFNMAVKTDFQGNSLASKLLKSISRSTERDLYTYSHNALMRKHILPNTGFKSLGEIYCVPL